MKKDLNENPPCWGPRKVIRQRGDLRIDDGIMLVVNGSEEVGGDQLFPPLGMEFLYRRVTEAEEAELSDAK